ncbi:MULTISPECIES: 4-(cytidine 5'-diphospho)-2-C-methyl-D-erythritol kinase [unclassified Guyparkeria]|uniref:4-(cytidine 5'-diphospho)-2-C-methyl-D-erythritol kinase n=1 Tax=unclassified Guyparkeria TaxID=2626246 RepID=UPI0007338408|nr:MULTISPECIES: 4-(cytidine 5'-diphospho)-2-C-methyl-D-erythritol kinase [unclassified Guyparkeria]KTG17764.1 hypothetical protein AUR63_06485 [Guyparkeria sp. XI15]OAE89475.1 hypothetical protein AWR35_06495 [Guyparkeria sp. WRN-7]
MNHDKRSLRVSAGCKLNLFLHINGRRPDGFHELQTYFQLIDYGDELRIATTTDRGIRVDWVAGDEDLSGRPTNPEDDLLYRAAMALRKAAPAAERDTRCNAHITLTKNAPIGGGLGGGSAAAARVLLELNRQWGLNLSLDRLCEIGVRLGADVPVFLRGQSATAHGIGDILHPGELPDGPDWFLILIPARTAPTAALFASPALERDTPKQDDARLLAHWRTEGFNAFEPVVLSHDAELTALRNALADYARFARLTGSGACLFAPVESAEAGRRIGERLQAEHPILRRFVVAPPLFTPNQEVSENTR